MKSKNLLNRPIHICLFILCWVLIACNSTPPTPVVEGNTPDATNSTTGDNQTIYLPLFQKNGDPFPIPTDAPLSEWTVAGGVIPVMPGAQAGGELDGSYVFTTFAPIPNIEAYYTQELTALGWEALSIAESPNKKELLFQMGKARVTIKMDFLADQNLSYVVIEG